MALKERQVIGRMYVINSVLEIGEKVTYLQTIIIIKDSQGEAPRKTISDKVKSCMKIAINGTMTKKMAIVATCK
jgi:5S rRNA maturation endonuclease (ribonuclease M5)